MIDLTKPVQTRDGRKVEILRTLRTTDRYNILGVVTHPNGDEVACAWTGEGESGVHDLDLVNLPPEKRWVNLYWYGGGDITIGGTFRTKAEAEAAARGPNGPSFIKTVEVDWPCSE